MAGSRLLSPIIVADQKELRDLVIEAEGYRDDAEAAEAVATAAAVTATTQASTATTQAGIAAAHVATSQSNALAAATSAASIQDTAARVGAMLRTRGITNIRAIAFKSAEGWEKTGRQSYKTETRPAGRFLGDYANATAAWAANYQGVATVAGDYYFQTSGTIGLFECTTSNASSQRYRAGSDHMPLEACFVASGTQIYIFDMTDPLMPLFAQVAAGGFTVTAMAYSNGILAVGNTLGVVTVDFDAATLLRQNSTGLLVGGLSAWKDWALAGWKTARTTGFLLNNNTINGLAFHGKRLAVATGGGVAVIAESRAVLLSSSSGSFLHVRVFNGRLFAVNDSSPDALLDYGPIESLGASFASISAWSSSLVPALSGAALLALSNGDNSFVIGQTSSLDQLWPNTADKESSLIARKGTTFATPPMKKPEVMLICGTTEGSVAGTELVTNGTYDSDVSGWTNTSPNTITWNSGAATLTRAIGSGAENIATQTMSVVAGAVYRVTYSGLSGVTGSNPFGVYIGATLIGSVSNNTAVDFFFTATTTGSVTFALAIRGNVPSGSPYVVGIDNVSMERIDFDRSGKSNHATINGTLTATAEIAGGVAGLSGFSAANYLEAADPWDGIGSGDGWISLAFKATATGVYRPLIVFGYHDGTNYVGARMVVALNVNNLQIQASNDGGATQVQSFTTSTYTDNQIYTLVVRKTATNYQLFVDGAKVGEVAIGAHGNLTFNALAKMYVGVLPNLTFPAASATIWFAGAGKTALSDEEAALMHTHMRNLILNKANLDEIPSALAYSPVTKAVEMVGATRRQTMIDGAIVSSVDHGQGTTPAVGTGSRGEVAVGGSTGVSISTPERNLREYEARLTKERFTVLYAGNASRTLFPLPTTAAEMAVTIDARPVRVSNAGAVQAEGAAEDFVIRDYGLGRYVVAFAVAPGNGNDVLVEFEREVYR